MKTGLMTAYLSSASTVLSTQQVLGSIGWMDGWMGRWMDGWMDEWMDG